MLKMLIMDEGFADPGLFTRSLDDLLSQGRPDGDGALSLLQLQRALDLLGQLGVRPEVRRYFRWSWTFDAGEKRSKRSMPTSTLRCPRHRALEMPKGHTGCMASFEVSLRPRSGGTELVRKGCCQSRDSFAMCHWNGR